MICEIQFYRLKNNIKEDDEASQQRGSSTLYYTAASKI